MSTLYLWGKIRPKTWKMYCKYCGILYPAVEHADASWTEIQQITRFRCGAALVSYCGILNPAVEHAGASWAEIQQITRFRYGAALDSKCASQFQQTQSSINCMFLLQPLVMYLTCHSRAKQSQSVVNIMVWVQSYALFNMRRPSPARWKYCK